MVGVHEHSIKMNHNGKRMPHLASFFIITVKRNTKDIDVKILEPQNVEFHISDNKHLSMKGYKTMCQNALIEAACRNYLVSVSKTIRVI